MTATEEVNTLSLKKNSLLELKDFLRGLLNDESINQEDFDYVLNNRRSIEDRDKHILYYIADLKVEDRKSQGRKLGIEGLAMALSRQCGQDYYRIDPLKIDAAQVTQVMSYAFTQRHHILAVEVTALEVKIASAEPYIDSWESDLEHVLKKKIVRVVSNPIAIKRLTTEMYSLSSSISRAQEGGSVKKGIGNLEQMLELGDIKDPEANDKHIVNVVDWILQYAFEQRASDIHIEPRREKGKVRDLPTTEMAIQAALTGHLVFTTLHTNDAPSAITRLLELGVPSYLIKATVIGIMAQRLVRVLCPHCKKETKIESETWEALTRPWKVKVPKKAYGAVGCLECRETGFKGREGIYEVMPFTEHLQQHSDDKGDLPTLRTQAYKEGMLSLRLSGAQKVAAGTTTVKEILRVTPDNRD